MKIQLLKSILTVLSALVTVGLSAQVQIGVPYFCGFEDAAENANWQLNTGSNASICTDRWVIGSSVFNEGLSAMYISHDGGVNAEFGHNPNIVVASREFTIANGRYEVSFDWKNKAVANSGLYVFLKKKGAPNSPESNIGATAQWLIGGQKVTLDNGTKTSCLTQKEDWTSAFFEFTSNNPSQALVLSFVWVNANRDTTLQDPLGACIDNIQIVSKQCPKPYDLNLEVVSCDSVQLSWKGSSEAYALEYKGGNTKGWVRINDIRTTEYLITGLSEGTYDFRVQGVCLDTLFSAYATLNSQLVFCPEMHCINFISLDGEGVTCYTGSAKDRNSFVPAKVDFGPASKMSRHTINRTLNQFDPRTGNNLRTIPDGELASVRIGNWNGGAEAERIEFSYTVEPGMEILIMKYAIVLEDPNHPIADQPYFSLKILDNEGNELDADCGSVNFYAGQSSKGWNTETSSGHMITWKDWSTMGLNLRPYVGDTIKVRLETRDCTFSAHYGYAYFTISCASGEIKSVSCGSSPEMDILAPEGFDYSWYSSESNEILGNDRKFTVKASDKTKYYCDCMLMGKVGCYFTLETVVSPRNPYPQYSYTWKPANCQNRVRIQNRSHVTTIDDNTGDTIHTDEPCQTSAWDFGEYGTSSENDPVIVMPDEGGKLPVSLVVGISDGECVESIFGDTIVVPSIISETRVVDTTVCYGSLIQFGEKLLNSKEYYPYYELEYTKPNIAGCDSTSILKLTVLPEVADGVVIDTICYGDTLWVGGKPLTSSVTNMQIWAVTAGGCDSVINVTLTVLDPVAFTVSFEDEVSGPGSGSITISDAPEGYTYSVNGKMNAALTGLVGGEYKIVVYNSAGCPSDTITVVLNRECLDIDVDIPDNITACADEKGIRLQYTLNQGVESLYAIEFGQKALSAGFENTEEMLGGGEILINIPDGCRPDVYDADIIIRDDICGDTSCHIIFSILYPSDIMVQKWNDAIALKNQEYNGGYAFSAFQWYRNSSPIPGENSPVLYLGNGHVFSDSDTYSVELTRTDDGVTQSSCELISVNKTDIAEYPMVQTVVMSGSRLVIADAGQNARVRIWNAAGILCADYMATTGNAEITAPSVPGMYVLQVSEHGEIRLIYKVMVK